MAGLTTSLVEREPVGPPPPRPPRALGPAHPPLAACAPGRPPPPARRAVAGCTTGSPRPMGAPLSGDGILGPCRCLSGVSSSLFPFRGEHYSRAPRHVPTSLLAEGVGTQELARRRKGGYP